MAWHTLNEAVKLTGRSRRSIYRDMNKGLVSYSVDSSGNRQFETSELMRAYGAFTSVAHPGTADLAQDGTREPWAILLTEVKALRTEVQELHKALLIEHKPDVKILQKPKIQSGGNATWADILNSLDK